MQLGVNGIHLNVEASGKGPSLVLLHGFTGDASTWDFLLPALGGFHCIRLDVIGHGRSDSPPDAERYRLWQAAHDILALLDGLGVDEFALAGYSMGGRLALHVALAAPRRLRCLVLESASPGIADEAERRARVESDEALAAGIESDGLEAFVERWQAQPLFASQARLPAETLARQRRVRLAQSPLGLANSLRGMGAGRQDWLLPRMGGLTMPSLVMAGALDARYASLAPLMGERLPHARVLIVPDAGHAVHLEQPDAFREALIDFLGAVYRPAGVSLHRESAEAN